MGNLKIYIGGLNAIALILLYRLYKTNTELRRCNDQILTDRAVIDTLLNDNQRLLDQIDEFYRR